MDTERDIKIETMQDFCKALTVLLKDPNFPEENIRTIDFIEAMQAWLEAIDGREVSFLDMPNERHITWSALFTIIEVGASYE